MVVSLMERSKGRRGEAVEELERMSWRGTHTLRVWCL